MINLLASAVEIDSNWLLGVITTLAATLWAFTLARFKKQDATIESQGEVIKNQGKTIEHLETDVERLSKGCGANGCIWKNRF